MNWKSVSLALLGIFILLSLVLLPDYGMTWDEPFRFSAGDKKLSYYSSFFTGEERPDMAGDSYPGLYDLPLALWHQLLPGMGSRSEKGHFLSFLFGLLGLVAVWRTAAVLGGERAGFLALILLVATPRYFGHMYMNPKDIPLAGTYALGIWALVRLFKGLPSPTTRQFLFVGIAFGLAMSTRLAGLLIFCYLGLFAIVYMVACKVQPQWISLSETGRTPVKEWLSWSRGILLAGFVALPILFLFWPSLHTNPFGQLSHGLETVQNYSWSGWVRMDGEFWAPQNLPVYYVPYWILVTLPENLLILSGIVATYALLLLVKAVSRNRFLLPERSFAYAIPVFAFLFPVGYLIVTGPVLYDGMRHFLFILPPLVVSIAVAANTIIRHLEEAGKALVGKTLLVLTILGTSWIGLRMAALHPYQYIHFNSFVGGLESAYLRDETDYWGLSHREAAEWLNENKASLQERFGSMQILIFQRYPPWMLEETLDEAFKVTEDAEEAHLFISITRMNLHRSFPEAELLHAVTKKEVPLNFIFQLK